MRGKNRQSNEMTVQPGKWSLFNAVGLNHRWAKIMNDPLGKQKKWTFWSNRWNRNGRDLLDVGYWPSNCTLVMTRVSSDTIVVTLEKIPERWRCWLGNRLFVHLKQWAPRRTAIHEWILRVNLISLNGLNDDDISLEKICVQDSRSGVSSKTSRFASRYLHQTKSNAFRISRNECIPAGLLNKVHQNKRGKRPFMERISQNIHIKWLSSSLHQTKVRTSSALMIMNTFGTMQASKMEIRKRRKGQVNEMPDKEYILWTLG